MPSPASSSAALPIANVVLRILIVLNWLLARVFAAGTLMRDEIEGTV